METIRLLGSMQEGSSRAFKFSASASVSQYLKSDSLRVDFGADVSDVPNSVWNIIFVANFLPWAWWFDAEIQVDELDADFYDCIPSVVEGYKKMYPRWEIKGCVKANNILANHNHDANRSAAFYSGGLDAVETMLLHFDEKPDLLTLWGADISYDNEDGWAVMRDNVKSSVDLVGLENIIIKSNFRFIEKENDLHQLVLPILGDGWWHGIKHALPLLGMAAPLAYKRGYKNVYIASTHCEGMGMVTCASNPWTDNQVRFCGCSAVHDSYNHSRQDKAMTVVRECEKRRLKMPMHVCWRTQTGDNCCKCEKCYRTIAELLIEGADPVEYGFADYVKEFTFKKVTKLLRRTFHAENAMGRKDLNFIWSQSKPRIKKRESILREGEYWPIFKWLLDHDLMSNKSITMPFEDRFASVKQRVRRMLSKIKRTIVP